jgi:cupin superfamily acireductone dioxygenase involved in methionine salvage
MYIILILFLGVGGILFLFKGIPLILEMELKNQVFNALQRYLSSEEIEQLPKYLDYKNYHEINIDTHCPEKLKETVLRFFKSHRMECREVDFNARVI